MKAGGKVADLEAGSALYKKYAELNAPDETDTQAAENKAAQKEASVKYEKDINKIAVNKDALLAFFAESEVKI